MPRHLIELLTTLLSSTFRQILWKQALELDLTYSQAQVLFHLARNPKSLVTDVARTFDITLPPDELGDLFGQAHHDSLGPRLATGSQRNAPTSLGSNYFRAVRRPLSSTFAFSRAPSSQLSHACPRLASSSSAAVCSRSLTSSAGSGGTRSSVFTT